MEGCWLVSGVILSCCCAKASKRAFNRDRQRSTELAGKGLQAAEAGGRAGTAAQGNGWRAARPEPNTAELTLRSFRRQSLHKQRNSVFHAFEQRACLCPPFPR